MLLEKLCNAMAPSSYEDEVRNIIKDSIRDFVDEVNVDKMGNIIAHKKGVGKTVILDAFMDEVGFIITGYNNDGTLKFTSLGNVQEKSIPCKAVNIGKNKISGVIGLKAIHLQNKKEREESIDIETLSIDIGATSKEEAKKYVSIGDEVSFTTEFEFLGEKYIKGKALESRVPCYVLIELLKENYNADIYVIFTTQRQIGSRGAIISSYNIKSDITLVLEGALTKEQENKIGKGPSISRIDNNTICDNSLIDDIKRIGEKEKIPYQIKKYINNENDGDSYISTGNTKKLLTISIPCKYMKSPISVSSKEDIENTIKLIRGYLKSL
ncbi:M42 family peptidase [Clostridium botulinum]|uniref:Aminopeptidase n=1 Tax=Clostridium botulinum C/D str. DC5 TaxID=1443128 RepID=A0A0A0I8F2_CLOBO|nr:M42 family peptidase [Clostridium botulinum]KEI04534.1 aminopeptidase [Clostridium botulinum C/D str. BKT75002]KEI07337.1 aminopeptidase [Clostridium botulinum C/D str. BKT2873]KGM95940.1 aminopeptidase [Clostridium botulinum C/D str. DC5]KGM96147.1 aminopeptidase [Clostridium botulinum D str. CCUG 7971]KOC49283.1 aminopeptidase [Clostridium botulinum]